MGATPVMKAAGEGERRWFAGGGTHTWKVTGDQSGGAFSMFEDEMEQGKSTPWHCHPDSEELMYLLDGEVDLNIDGQTQRMTAGAVWMTPRGVSHAFVVVSPTAKLLAIQTPGSAGQFYWDASEPAETASGTVDVDRVRAVAAATGVTDVQGPPPFVTA